MRQPAIGAKYPLNLYGTTSGGGFSDAGVVFELTGSGFVVPEPASLSMLALGGIGLLRRSRRGL